MVLSPKVYKNKVFGALKQNNGLTSFTREIYLYYLCINNEKQKQKYSLN